MIALGDAWKEESQEHEQTQEGETGKKEVCSRMERVMAKT